MNYCKMADGISEMRKGNSQGIGMMCEYINENYEKEKKNKKKNLPDDLSDKNKK